MARKTILIVGGGTAGWLTAIVLHKKYDIHLVQSKSIPTIGVGESTTETVMDALRKAGVDICDFVEKCNATPKYGVLFSNWAEKDYFHAFGENFLEKQYGASECAEFLTKCYKTGKDITKLSPYTAMAEKAIYPDFNSKEEFFNDTALHWQATAVAEYFKNFLKDKIKHTYDTITAVHTNELGITSVAGKTDKYIADFYVDCTGSKRMLSKELGIEWQSWKNDTTLNAALVYSCAAQPNTYYTKASAWDNGWEWNIPLQDRTQNGYVYSSNHCSKEEAKAEIQRRRGDVEILGEIHFDAGVLEKISYKNMMSIGLSAHFIEPLEATNIELAVIMAKEFDKAIEENDIGFTKLNERVLEYVYEIKKFVIFHYALPEKTGQFWKDTYQQYTEKDVVNRKTVYPWHIFNWYSVAQGINFDTQKYENIDVDVEYLTSEFKAAKRVAEIERMASKTRDLPQT